MPDEITESNIEPEWWDKTMSNERYFEIENNYDAILTEEEIKNGWHFCYEFDGLLVNANDPKMKACGCICLGENFNTPR